MTGTRPRIELENIMMSEVSPELEVTICSALRSVHKVYN